MTAKILLATLLTTQLTQRAARMYDLSIADAIRLLPTTRGKRVHAKTVSHWIVSGIRGVRLAAERIGGRWYTSLDSLRRFQAALTEARTGTERVDADADSASRAALARISRRYGINVGTGSAATTHDGR